MPEVLACVDASGYARSVCDHAAWFAGRLDCPTRVIHAAEDPNESNIRANSIVRSALEVLLDEGIENCCGQVFRTSLADAAVKLSPQMLVMGKRGSDSDPGFRILGSHVAPLINAVTVPVCLASQVFLPINRALVILDANMDHRHAVEFVNSHPGLRGLEIDLIVATAPGKQPDQKIAWAREALGSCDVDVFAVIAESLLSAIESYTQTRTCDLIIVSRSVLVANVTSELARFEASGIWSWRTPILVC